MTIQEAGWLETNPVKVIKPPKVDDSPTLPYTKEEFERVIKACDNYPRKQHAVKLRALVLLLRYSGLRITDAVNIDQAADYGWCLDFEDCQDRYTRTVAFAS